MLPALLALAFLGVLQHSFGGVFEPRTLEIARERFVEARPLAVPTFAGMPFLEKPPLFADILAAAFVLVGRPSVAAARIVVGLVACLWLAGVYLCGRRAAGRGAGLLAASLAALAPLFLTLARRVALDDLLAALATLALAAAATAARSSRGPLRRGPWLLFLLLAGAAFLTKGLFGSFLVLTPLLAFAAWAGDRRILRALLRPTALVLLAAPVLLWAAVLHAEGGVTYLAEAFVNNSLGRFLDIRFALAGTADLPYGDVVGPAPAWEYLTSLPSLAGLTLLVLPVAALALVRRRPRLRGPRARTAAMALCWALVPLVLLSFSSQKGVHHLGSCTSGLAVVGALWLQPRLRTRGDRRSPGWTRPWLVVLGLSAPVVLAAALLDHPPGRLAAVLAGCLLLVAATSVGLLLWRRGQRWEATWGLLAGLAGAVLLGYSARAAGPEPPGIPDVARWLKAEVGTGRLAAYRWGDSDLGTFCFVMEREVTALREVDAVAEFLASPEPSYCVVRGRLRPSGTDGHDPAPGGLYARRSGGGRTYTLYANTAGLARRPDLGPSPAGPPDGD